MKRVRQHQSTRPKKMECAVPSRGEWQSVCRRYRESHYNTKGNNLLGIIIIIAAKFRIFIETLRQEETTTIPFLAENVCGQHTPCTYRIRERS